MTDKERYADLKSRGICVYCKTAPTEDGKTTCRICRAKQRQQTAEKRVALKKMGFCVDCGSNQIYGSENICPECAAKKYIQNRQRPKDKERDRQYQHDRKERLKAAGTCVKCGKRKAESGKTRCQQCNVAERTRARAYRGNYIPRYERPTYGMCYFCGTKIESGKICDSCRERNIKNLPESKPNEFWRSDEEIRRSLVRQRQKGG